MEKILKKSQLDNQYTINCIAKNWIYKWEREGWYDRVNSDLLKELLFEYRKFPDGNVRFNWIKGHSGIEQNEKADKLAGQGSRNEIIIVDQPIFIFIHILLYFTIKIVKISNTIIGRTFTISNNKGLNINQY